MWIVWEASMGRGFHYWMVLGEIPYHKTMPWKKATKTGFKFMVTCSSSLRKVSWPIFVKHRHIMVQTFPPAAMVGNARGAPEHLPLPDPTVEHKYLCLHHSAIHSPFFFAYVGHEEQSTTPSWWRRIHRFLSAKWVLLCSNDAHQKNCPQR